MWTTLTFVPRPFKQTRNAALQLNSCSSFSPDIRPNRNGFSIVRGLASHLLCIDRGSRCFATYIHTWEGWLYLALVIDRYSRKIVGWAIDDNYKTPLIQAAIRMAATNVPLPSGAIFHSDRGSNYQCRLVKLVDVPAA
ncbi:MAG: DDE-type integrase/transposase/recombinase [Isosphaeraceae bacterium]